MDDQDINKMSQSNQTRDEQAPSLTTTDSIPEPSNGDSCQDLVIPAEDPAGEETKVPDSYTTKTTTTTTTTVVMTVITTVSPGTEPKTESSVSRTQSYTTKLHEEVLPDV